MTAHAQYSNFTAISSFLKSLYYAEQGLNKVLTGMTKGEWAQHSSVKKNKMAVLCIIFFYLLPSPHEKAVHTEVTQCMVDKSSQST